MDTRTFESPVPQLLETNAFPSAEEAHAIREILQVNEPKLVNLEISIASAKALLAKLISERDEVAVVVNSHRRLLSRLLDFPTELLGVIFTQCLPATPTPPTKHSAPLLLCAVCKRWRAVALATPVLWSYISTTITTSSVYRHGNRNPAMPVDRMVALWLERSQECPLHIHIRSYIPLGPTTGAVMRTLVAHIHRWKSLSVDSLIPSMLSVPVGRDKFALRYPSPPPSPLLESVNVMMQFKHDEPFFEWIRHLMDQSMALRRVTWNRDPSILPWNRLTHVRLTGRLSDTSTITGCLGMLQRATALIRCDLKVKEAANEVIPASLSALTLHTLVELVLSFTPRAVNVGPLLDALTLPSLRLLSLSLSKSWPHAQVLSLLTRSSTALQEFRLIATSITDAQLLACLQHKAMSASLSVLYIYQCRGAITDRVLAFLTPTAEHPSTMHNIQELTLDACVVASDGRVSDMIQSRRKAFTRFKFTVTLDGQRHKKDWEYLDGLQENPIDGLKIRVYGEESDYGEGEHADDDWDSDQ